MDVESGGARSVLYLSGFPNPAEWQQGIMEEVKPLDAAWRLTLGEIATDAPSRARHAQWGLEHLYRLLDRRLFGRALRRATDLSILNRAEATGSEPGSLHLAYCASSAAVEAVKRSEPVLYVEYEGMKMADLEEAVRLRFGVAEATLNAQVWAVDPTRQKRLLFQGQLDLDHRSLCQSIALCAAKLPAMLRGALARLDQPGFMAVPVAPRAATPLPAHRLLGRLLQAIAKRLLWREQWQIEIYCKDDGADGQYTLSTYLKPPPSRFWADPFLVNIKDRTWLLYEELPFSTDKGHITAVELDARGVPLSPPQVVLSEPWHLAYPFTFEDHGKLYMMPDASKSRELILYECGDTPLTWQRRFTLMSGVSLADCTIARHDGRLWMFGAHADDDASVDDTLYIYWADQLEGPWHPHSLNPVKIDAACSRPAGTMWTQDGMLHRVVQNCSSAYGGGTACMRVRVLNEHEFEEEAVPDWVGRDLKSSVPWHTFNRHGNVLVTDRLRRVPRWAAH